MVILPQGWQVLKTAVCGEVGVVLAYNPSNKITPWVTWVFNAGCIDQGVFWGHYNDSEADAKADFIKRASMVIAA